jgi:putative tricarboxylic transport membrane protein
MAKADFITGLVLIALGAAALIASIEMPRFEERAINPYTVPGLVPGVLGAVILVLGTALLVRAARAGGWRLVEGREGPRWWAEAGVQRLGLSIVLCVGYAAGLVGRVPFWLATFVFVALFVAVFEWPQAATGSERARRIGIALVLGAVVSAAVTRVFQEVFLVRLP